MIFVAISNSDVIHENKITKFQYEQLWKIQYKQLLFTISLYIPMQIVHQKYCVVVWFSSINHCQFYSIVSIIFNYNYPISCTVTFTETSAACKRKRFQNSFSFYHSLSIISSKWKDIKNIEVRFCRAIEILKSHLKYFQYGLIDTKQQFRFCLRSYSFSYQQNESYYLHHATFCVTWIISSNRW